jgi:hypothetical protein
MANIPGLRSYDKVGRLIYFGWMLDKDHLSEAINFAHDLDIRDSRISL